LRGPQANAVNIRWSRPTWSRSGGIAIRNRTAARRRVNARIGTLLGHFAQAQKKARDWFKLKAQEAAGDVIPHDGPYTVADAFKDYLTGYERRGGKALYDTRRAAETHILPALGEIAVAKLSKIEDWHRGLAEQAARLRTKLGRKQNYRKG
jgi:hypothetical protein